MAGCAPSPPPPQIPAMLLACETVDPVRNPAHVAWNDELPAGPYGIAMIPPAADGFATKVWCDTANPGVHCTALSGEAWEFQGSRFRLTSPTPKNLGGRPDQRLSYGKCRIQPTLAATEF